MESLVQASHQEVAVSRLRAEGSELAVFEFQGQLRDLLVSNLRETYLSTGSYAPDSKAVSNQGAASLVVAASAAGAAGLSASFSSTLFMATANPATLMTLGSGVGSAVMGTSGILRQAAFIPVASSLPVVAPILAIQALNAAVVMRQFRQVDQKLDLIKKTLDKAIARIEATHAGELIAASHVVDEVYWQYEVEGIFSNDMIVRLALTERDVRSLSNRFRLLVQSREVTNVEDLGEVRQSNYDAHSSLLASLLELRIAYLRVCVDLQENPKSVARSIDQLKLEIDEDVTFWNQLMRRSRALKEEIAELESELKEMNWAKRSLPGFVGGEGASAEKELVKLNAAYSSTMESELEIMEGFHSLIETVKKTRDALDESSAEDSYSPTLVYWKDESGEHSFITQVELVA